MHRGVVVEGGCVYHNTPFQGEHISTIQEFSKNRRMYVEHRTPEQRELALESLRTSDSHKYNLFTSNCEHTVSRAFDEAIRSPQLVSFLISGGVAAATLVLTRSLGLAAAGFAITRRLTERKPTESVSPHSLLG